jgi:Rieske [2Fe-2S] domain
MSVRRRAPDIARSLERHGMVFQKIEVQSEGVWSDEDADWNYKDVPHLNEVHSNADTVPALIGDDVICTVNIQKLFGLLPMPIALVNYVASDDTQVYYTTLLFFVLVVQTNIESLEPGLGESCRARAQTTYHVGGPRFLRWMFPLMRRMLLSNYKVLMSEDLPMREQRGRLRSAGYQFVSDGRQRTFEETTDLNVVNVVPPPVDADQSMSADISSLRLPGAELLLGHGPAGLRIVKGGDDQVLVFDRVCSHEGACLDKARMSGDVIVCPWHGKRVKPLAVLSLDGNGPQQWEVAPGQRLELEGSSLRAIGFSGE